MSTQDWHRLRDAMGSVFDGRTAAFNVLDRIEFPRNQRPSFDDNPQGSWMQIFNSLDNGIIASPRRQLLLAASTVYPFNPVFLELSERYGVVAPRDWAVDPAAEEEHEEEPADDLAEAPAGTARLRRGRVPAVQQAGAAVATSVAPTCHVIVRAGSEQERGAAIQILSDLGLEPHDVWATAHATSFRVGSGNAAEVRELMDPTGLSWVVVPPEANDYLIRELYVDGPDQRRFRLIDAPAQQTVADVVAGIMAHYGASFNSESRRAVVDRVLPSGEGQRLSPEMTLDEAGVRDGASLRMGFQATAGSVNPMIHQDALRRMRNQILHFAKSRPDLNLVVSGEPPMLPTRYEIRFAQPSFGPPEQPSREPVTPVRVSDHLVRVEFLANFPAKPPRVFWDSPIFHPNIFPKYDCEKARRRPALQGLVCLGVLYEAYTPALSFAELCKTLIDMAAYRNYSVLEPTGETLEPVEGIGAEAVAANFLDVIAATWAWEHQSEIIAMGGSPAIRRSLLKRPYRNAIEVVS